MYNTQSDSTVAAKQQVRQVFQVSTGTGNIGLSAKGVHRELFILSLKFAERNVPTTIICSDTDPESSEGVRVMKIHVPWLKSIRRYSTPFSYFTTVYFTLRSIPKVIRLANSNFDILHVHFHIQVIIYSLVRRWLHLGYRIVYTPRGIAHYRFRLLERLALESADGIVALTPHALDAVRSLITLSDSKISVIPIPPTSVPTLPDIFLSAKPLNREEGLVVCVASIQPRKNQMTLIKSIERLFVQGRKVRLVLIGSLDDRNYYQKLEQIVAANHLPVSYIGSISNEALCRYLSQAKVMCLPSFKESQCVAVLEAMYFGLPVVASDIGPIRDLVTGFEKAALLIPPADDLAFSRAIGRVIDDSKLWQELSSEGRKLVFERYSWSAAADREISFYNHIVRSF